MADRRSAVAPRRGPRVPGRAAPVRTVAPDVAAGANDLCTAVIVASLERPAGGVGGSLPPPKCGRRRPARTGQLMSPIRRRRTGTAPMTTTAAAAGHSALSAAHADHAWVRVTARTRPCPTSVGYPRPGQDRRPKCPGSRIDVPSPSNPSGRGIRGSLPGDSGGPRRTHTGLPSRPPQQPVTTEATGSTRLSHRRIAVRRAEALAP